MGSLFAAVIILSIALVISVIALCVMFYHQMLLVNEVNKRLLLVARESIEKERITKEEQTEALIQLAIATEANTPKQSDATPAYSEDEIEANFYSDTNY